MIEAFTSLLRIERICKRSGTEIEIIAWAEKVLKILFPFFHEKLKL